MPVERWNLLVGSPGDGTWLFLSRVKMSLTILMSKEAYLELVNGRFCRKTENRVVMVESAADPESGTEVHSFGTKRTEPWPNFGPKNPGGPD